MTNPRNNKVRVGFILGAFVCLVAFNLSIMPDSKGSQQMAFENWLGEIDPKLENLELTGTPLPPLSVTIDAPARAIHLALAVGPVSDQAASTRFARILQMAREANLLSLPPKDNPEVRLLIETDRGKFSAAFNVADIEQNSQAQAMLKLLEIYSGLEQPDSKLANSNVVSLKQGAAHEEQK